ncbi:MAG: sulfotransferase [bacterium]
MHSSVVLQEKETSTGTPRRAKLFKMRTWSPRMWYGYDFFGWLRLLARNAFTVDPPYLYFAIMITCVSLYNTLLSRIQDLFYGRQVRQTEIKKHPLFIIGHWRTGTTLLHEFFALDPQFSYPTTYQCFVPNHFLLSERFNAPWLRYLLPSQRPMDNIEIGLGRPQEDEFALCIMGQPSPYQRIAFPNGRSRRLEYLDLEELTPQDLERWKKSFVRFLKQITYRNPGQIVLKSPPHTCRIKTLLELFPEAKFVHIVRNPYVVFPSTIHMLKSLSSACGLQKPNFEGLEDNVFQTFEYMYKKLEEGRALVHPSHFYELRYEDLVRNPIGQMRAMYEHLGLGDFEKVLPALEDYVGGLAGYQTNRYELSGEMRAEITRRWGSIIQKYNYDT